ncbi:MAG TPA: hypothetical protein VJB09_01995 [Candidatus Paceibacterota bacterium]
MATPDAFPAGINRVPGSEHTRESMVTIFSIEETTELNEAKFNEMVNHFVTIKKLAPELATKKIKAAFPEFDGLEYKTS